LVKKAAEKFGSEAPAIQELNRQKDVLFSDLLKCSMENPRVANFVFRNIGSIVSKKIIDIVALINPELIVIGGDIAQVSFFIKEYLMPYVKRKSVELFPAGISLPPIIFSRFGIFSVSVGATALILSEIFKEEDHKPLGSRRENSAN
jgi:predicted NBD/HSP70 family sugar kinase